MLVCAKRERDGSRERSIFAPNRTVLLLVNFTHVHIGTRDSLQFLSEIYSSTGDLWRCRFRQKCRNDTR